MDRVILKGTLTSRIETKKDKLTQQDYHYGFFQIEGQEQDIPVIFKENKPNLKKGIQVELTGQWAQSDGERPSFTCAEYKLLSVKETENEVEEKANIYQKLCQIQSQTGKITKAEQNKFQNYKYFTEFQALEVLKPLLAEHKLTLTFSDEIIPTKYCENVALNEDNFTNLSLKKQEKDWVVKYLKQATLTNSDNPTEQLTFHFWACGQNSDLAKAKGCAETYAIKYFLTKFFLIPTTDILDPDITKDHERANRLANGKQETAQEIQKRHEEKDQQRIAELKLKYGPDWKLSTEHKQWMGNWKEAK